MNLLIQKKKEFTEKMLLKKARKKVQKSAKICTKCAFFCKKVREIHVFLHFCAPDFQSDASIS